MPYILFLIIPLSLSCSTLKDSLLLGAASGAALGASAGAIVDVPQKNQTKSILLGTAIGSLLGALGGFLKFREKSKTEIKNSAPTFSSEKTKSETETTPSLSKPVVRKVWIPAKIEDDKFIEGHFIYVIERQSIWQN